MKLAEAKRWIERHYGNPIKYQKTQEAALSNELYMQALSHFKNLKFVTKSEKTSQELFLYDGCARFCRWFVPSPSSVPHHYREKFKYCAATLLKVEKQAKNGQVMNAPVFMVHSIRDEIYAEFADTPLPLDPEKAKRLEELFERLNAVPAPVTNGVKNAEFLKQKLEVEQVILGLRSGTLRSHLKTTLPYPLAIKPIEFRMKWSGVNLTGTLSSTFTAPSDLIVQAAPPNAIAPGTTTRWQYGRTLVKLEFEGLIDPSIQVPALQLPAMELPFNDWPNGLRLAFEIVYQVCWELRQYPDFISIWVPAPADLGDIDSWISCPDKSDINYIRRAHPSMSYKCVLPEARVLSLELGVVRPSPWHMRCRVLAEQYAMLGEAREALFWLNVGVEALLKARMEAHIAKNSIDIDIEKLNGADAYWDEAKALIADRFPEIVDEIEWPESSKKPSRYSQVKYFCRRVPSAPDTRTVLKNYSKVSRKRNALFHGESEDPISMEDLMVAKEGFDWLAAEFFPSNV